MTHPARYSKPVLDAFGSDWARWIEQAESECWLWTGATDRDGYGLRTFGLPGGGRRTVRVHRYAWEVANGAIPAGLQVDHLCNVKNCMNPEHLRCCSLVENLLAEHSMSRPRELGLRTHCDQGHEFTDENTYIRLNGEGRACRECAKLKMRRRRALGAR